MFFYYIGKSQWKLTVDTVYIEQVYIIDLINYI